MNKYIYTCTGSSDGYTFYVPGTSVPGGLPAWLLAASESHQLNVSIDTAPSAGTYGPYDFGTLTLYVVVAASCVESYNPCCGNTDCNIQWINQYGGRENYIFTGTNTLEARQEGKAPEQYEVDRVLRYSHSGHHYDGVTCYTRNIPRSHIDKIWRLKHSIQAWLYNTTTEAFDIPIIIDRNSFVKRNTKDRTFIMECRFRYAERLNIQTQ